MRKRSAKNGLTAHPRNEEPAQRIIEWPLGGTSNQTQLIARLVGLDPSREPVDRLEERIASLPGSRRGKLIRLCDRMLQTETFRNKESLRVCAAKVLVALLPESQAAIHRWLQRTDGRQIREVHFSLFCFLDWTARLPRAQAIARRVPKWTEHYLSEAKSGSSYSAWMAGEMLGEHWDPKEAVPILVRIARDGPFAAGRRGALHGLAHALGRSPKPLARHIMLCLEYVKGDDRSRSVREYAALIAHGQDACSR